MQRTYNELEMQTIQQAERGDELPGPVPGSAIPQLRDIDRQLERVWRKAFDLPKPQDFRGELGLIIRDLIILCAKKDIGLIECLQIAHDSIEESREAEKCLTEK